MQTTLRIDGANCPTCFNETLDDLARLDGVRSAHGSIAGPCIEVDHDVAIEAITATIRNRLHGIEMFANEIRMVPLEPVAMSMTCTHQAHTATSPSRTEPGAIDPSITLGEIVTFRPSLAADLERRGLDYCCHGGRTLAEAARDAGLDAETVAQELEALTAAHGAEPAAEWASLGLAELVDHIETVHHHYLWAEMPRISALVDKIVTVHSERHPELADVQRIYNELRAELEPHLTREEQELFPMIRQLAATANVAGPDNRSLIAQIEALASEHETVGDLLDELNHVTSGYSTPADGCATYAACYLALAELESDTHLHVHKENNVLFPAAQAESTMSTAPSTPGTTT